MPPSVSGTDPVDSLVNVSLGHNRQPTISTTGTFCGCFAPIFDSLLLICAPQAAGLDLVRELSGSDSPHRVPVVGEQFSTWAIFKTLHTAMTAPS